MRTVLGSAGCRDSRMTWVTLSNGACLPFFPLEVGIFDLARPLNSRGKRGSRQSKNAGEYMRQLRRFSEGKVLPMS
jgi:hypothetical protein